jgi:hypothetical protein
MKKVNFRELEVELVNGETQKVYVHEAVGNYIFNNANDVAEHDLGRDIYHSHGEMELSDKQAKIIERMADGMKYVLRQSLKNAVKHDDE